MLYRWRWAIGIALLLAAGLAWTFYPQAIAVDVAPVTQGPMATGVTDDGVTRIEDVYTVSAPTTGELSRIELKVGDPVVAGQTVIARMTGRASPPLDPRMRAELGKALASAQAALRAANAARDLAAQDLRRAEALAQKGYLSRARLDAARAGAAQAQAGVAQASAEVARNRAALSEPARANPATGPVIVRSPASGVVLRVLTESQGVVAEGTPLVEVGDPSKIEVVIDLLSREAVKAKPGDRVEITRWGGDRPLIGQVKRIEPYGRLKISALGIEEQRVNVIVRFAEDAQMLARLGHGYQLDATIVEWRRDDAVRAPIGSLFRGTDGGWRAYAVEDGRAVEHRLRIGHINDEYAEVLAGLAAGDRVIVNPGASVKDGVRVKAR